MFQHRKVTPDQVEAAKKYLSEKHRPGFGTTEWLQRVYSGMVIRVSQQPSEVETQIQAMCIGDLGLVSLPGEMFVEIGMEIKKQSPFQRTMVVSLAKDYLGYIPTDKAFVEGSYETLNSRAALGTAPAMIKMAVKLLMEHLVKRRKHQT